MAAERIFACHKTGLPTLSRASRACTVWNKCCSKVDVPQVFVSRIYPCISYDRDCKLSPHMCLHMVKETSIMPQQACHGMPRMLKWRFLPHHREPLAPQVATAEALARQIPLLPEGLSPFQVDLDPHHARAPCGAVLGVRLDNLARGFGLGSGLRSGSGLRLGLG